MKVLRANIREREKLLGLCYGFFIFLFWWLGVEVVVGGGGGGGGCGCGCGHGLLVMSSQAMEAFKRKYQREGEVSPG